MRLTASTFAKALPALLLVAAQGGAWAQQYPRNPMEWPQQAPQYPQQQGQGGYAVPPTAGYPSQAPQYPQQQGYPAHSPNQGQGGYAVPSIPGGYAPAADSGYVGQQNSTREMGAKLLAQVELMTVQVAPPTSCLVRLYQGQSVGSRSLMQGETFLLDGVPLTVDIRGTNLANARVVLMVEETGRKKKGKGKTYRDVVELWLGSSPASIVSKQGQVQAAR